MGRTLLFFLLISSFAVTGGFPQEAAVNEWNGPPLRVEIPVKSSNETYRVIPCGSRGLVIFYRSEEEYEGKTNWYFAGYDTSLVQVWVQPVPLPSGREFRFSRFGRDTLALLFSAGTKSKAPGNTVDLIRIRVADGKAVLNTIALENGDAVSHFALRSGRAWLGLTARSESARILTVGLGPGKKQVFQPGAGDRMGLLWMEPDSLTPTLTAVVARQESKKVTSYFLVRYDTTGKILSETVLRPGSEDHRLNRVTAVSAGDGLLLLGTYGQDLVSKAAKDGNPGLSTGLFSCLVRNGTSSFRFYNFLAFSNAASFVGENGMMYLKKKALKKNRTLEEYSLDYLMLIHGAFRHEGRYVLLAESYTPQYHTESFTDFDFYGRPYTNSYSVFDGYRFFNAVAAAFDQEGGLAWDNCMEIRNLISFDLAPKVTAFPSGEDIVLCYSSEGKIGSRIIREGAVSENLDFSDLEMMRSDDKLVSESKGMLTHWYGDYFITQGYQEIKNIAQESNNRRMVFCFSKLRFDP